MKKFTELYYETVECVRCNLCLDRCPVVRAVGIDKAPMYASVYSAMGSRFDLDCTAEDAIACIDCYECEAACPVQVPVADTMCHVRGLAVNEGMMNDAMRTTMEKARTGKNILGEPVKVENGKGDVAFFPGYAGEIDQAVLDAFMALCKAAGVNSTIVTGVDSGYLVSRSGFGDDAEKYVQTNVERFRESGAKTIVTPCSYSYEAMLRLYPDEFEYLHIGQFLDQLMAEGKLNLKVAASKVAYHDPHFLSRVNGVYEEPRNIIAAASGNDAVEPLRTGTNTSSSGIGGGLGLFRPDLMQQLNQNRAAELAALGCDTVVCGCVFEKYALKESLAALGIKTVDLTEYAAAAL